ncbi:MAG: 50S ribosomal protein L18 [Chloroflexi bacterium]|nr:50S ribosomal protein L18 [Chloroflexota bacterium]
MPRIAVNPWHMRRVRHQRVRKSVMGSPERPRLCVFQSLHHIYVQVIDDSQGRTLVTASTVGPALREQAKGLKKTEAAKLVGKLVAQRSKEKGITQAVFDRGGYQYHGRIKALADAAREGGLVF